MISIKMLLTVPFNLPSAWKIFIFKLITKWSIGLFVVSTNDNIYKYFVVQLQSFSLQMVTLTVEFYMPNVLLKCIRWCVIWAYLSDVLLFFSQQKHIAWLTVVSYPGQDILLRKRHWKPSMQIFCINYEHMK